MEIKKGNQTTILPDTTPTFTLDEWRAEGERRFGKNYDAWKFVCPMCGNIAAIGDYKPYAAKGATPQSAAQECIGRYTGGRSAMGETKGKPCDYAIYGLFRFPGAIIVLPDGDKIMAFAFAEATA